MQLRLPLFLCLAAGLGWQPASVSAQTLDEALVGAYLRNPILASARADLRATDEQVPQAVSGWRPTVSMAGDYGRELLRDEKVSGSVGDQNRDPASLSLTVDQPLYRGGRTVSATNRALNNIRAARARLAVSEQTVFFDAVTAFMNVVRDQAVLELRINNEQVLRRQLEATQDRFDVGEVTRTDVHQAQARLAGTEADRIQAEGDLEVSRATYKRIVGESPQALTPPELPTDVPESGDAAVELAVDANPRVLAAQFDERASVDNIDQIRGELLPTVSLTGSAARDYDASGEDTEVSSYEARILVSVPLYQSGAVYSRLRGAKQTVVGNRQRIEDARRSSVEAATAAWETMVSAQAAIEAIGTQVTASEVALDGVRREADVGSRTVLDVLDAEQELLDSRVNLVLAQRDLTVAVFLLKSAIGQLTAEKLKLPVDYYDPGRHYREVRGRWFGGSSSDDADNAE